MKVSIHSTPFETNYLTGTGFKCIDDISSLFLHYRFIHCKCYSFFVARWYDAVNNFFIQPLL
jgi:hypothetical protein